ncbi:gamma-glutamyl-gamma-aminobutyrate hydrolase family protein [Lacticaseibacillus hulanensis]|uniref:gamma-glutamyl-gamma-aminobutyrate hydrolase family protein n=1 Tax=Lacticaseibacillus hulanensis TaxID=2493111 RepID=UPI0019D465D5|nr:gamma-glutamyl-gamma-aminobutyrate hydrolase family protein [Lacticaseibacillus hulanensis]
MKPIIALTADALIDHSPVINQHDADMAPSAIKEAIIKAGGVPIILPFPADTREADALAQEVVSLFDGLVLPGGPDVDPTFFGEEPVAAIGRTAYQKDAFEIALIKAVRAAGKPVFAICRGIQIYNVALGGTLYQDLPSQDPDYRIRHAQAAPGNFPTHHIHIAAGSQTERLLGERSYVNSRHHQAVRDAAPGLTVTATADDGVIEGLESIDDDSFIGVQWHPENMWTVQTEQFAFFEDIVRRARRFKENHYESK